MSKIILVTGGARSGKSKFAESLAKKLGDKAAYIATAQIFDDEMAHRVKIHQSRRNNFWTTYEAPFDADKVIMTAAETFDVILFDCVTIYLSNFLCAANLNDIKKIYRDAEILIGRLIYAAKISNTTVIFVSNEVGAGIVPENKLARIFRDVAGLANQKISAQAEKVFLTVAGLAIDLKKICEPSP